MAESSSSRAVPPPLERGYRRVLRALPRGYRAQWEEDMVAALLDSEQEAAARAVAAEGPARQDEERGLVLLQRPPLREVAGVLGLAVRLHLAAPSTPGATARSRAVGDAVRLTALLGLLVPAAFGVQQLVLLPWWARQPGWSQVTRADGTWWVASSLVALLTWTLLVAGHRRAAVGVALAGVVAPWVAGGAQLPLWALQPRELVVWLVLLVPLLCTAAWHRDAPPPARRWWWALPASAAVLLGLAGLQLVGAVGALDTPDLVVAAAALAVGWWRHDRGWCGAAVLLGGVALVRALATLGYLTGLPEVYGLVGAAVTTASGLVVVVALARWWRLAGQGRPARV